MSIRQRFVKYILEDEGRRLMKNQTTAINQRLHSQTHYLLSSRRIFVSSDEDFDGQLKMTHTAYQRFLDMKYIKYGSLKVRQNRKIHNRFVWGHYNSIAKRLMYDLTNDTIAMFKEKLDTDK